MERRTLQALTTGSVGWMTCTLVSGKMTRGDKGSVWRWQQAVGSRWQLTRSNDVYPLLCWDIRHISRGLLQCLWSRDICWIIWVTANQMDQLVIRPATKECGLLCWSKTIFGHPTVFAYIIYQIYFWCKFPKKRMSFSSRVGYYSGEQSLIRSYCEQAGVLGVFYDIRRNVTFCVATSGCVLLQLLCWWVLLPILWHHKKSYKGFRVCGDIWLSGCLLLLLLILWNQKKCYKGGDPGSVWRHLVVSC